MKHAREIVANVLLGWAMSIGGSQFCHWLINEFPREARKQMRARPE